MTGDPPSAAHPALDAVPPPVLFNAWKHHAGWVRGRVAVAVAGGPAGVDRLAAEVVVVGARLMDLYVGDLSPAAVAGAVVAALRAACRLEVGAYRAWLGGQGGYAVVTVPADGSRWTLRVGPAGGRYVHLHPGRGSPHTVRVQANPLKTAVLAHAVAGLSGGDPSDVGLVNEARRRYLGLPPVSAVDPAGGLGEAIRLLL